MERSGVVRAFVETHDCTNVRCSETLDYATSTTDVTERLFLLIFSLFFPSFPHDTWPTLLSLRRRKLSRFAKALYFFRECTWREESC